MKKLDKLFLFLLVVLPLSLSLAIFWYLSRQDDVSPEDSSAQQIVITTPTYSLDPVATATPTPTTTRFADDREGDYQTAETGLAQKAKGDFYAPDSDQPSVQQNETDPAGPSDEGPLELPKTAGDDAVDSYAATETDDSTDPYGLDTTNIIIFAAVVALVFGGLVMFGMVLRGQKQDR